MQSTGLDRKFKFNYKKFKSTFVILSILFSIFGCGIENTSRTSSSSYGNENRSDSANSSLENAVKLSWVAPNTNADSTKLTDLGGYIVYYREKTDTDYTYAIDVGYSTFITINDLSSGIWCFALTSYDRYGNESDYSAEACKEINETEG